LIPVLNPVGVPFIELRTVDSTNNYAMAMVHEGMAQHGTAVFAHEQTNGKGQRQKQWLAHKGENLILTVVITAEELALSQAFTFSMAMALSVYGFFNKYAGAETCIKWPNDLYWRDRKAGGILIENVVQGTQWKYAIVGMGINLNQTAFGALSKAVSLKQITGITYDTVAMAKELCTSIDHYFKLLHQDKSALQQAYHQHLYKKDEVVRLKKGSRVFDARIKGVNAAGQLVAQHAVEETFDIGDVEWVI
jgi:BirA family biotin operon repressor/biotin-[acetyl-CoA-carboxylase] ligase